jgi:hypothetical protein
VKIFGLIAFWRKVKAVVNGAVFNLFCLDDTLRLCLGFAAVLMTQVVGISWGLR